MLSTAALTVIAAWARVTHQSWNGSILNIAFIFIAASVIFGIFEIFQSDKIETIEKVIWALAFMFTPVISFIIYLRVRRYIQSNKLKKWNSTN